MSKDSVYITAIVIIAIMGILLNIFNKKIETKVETPLSCPQDLKLCSDGNYVGRVLPDCEFLECPQTEEISNGSFDEENASTTDTTND